MWIIIHFKREKKKHPLAFVTGTLITFTQQVDMHIVCAYVHSLTIKSFKISDLNPVEIYTLSLKSLKIIIVLISTLKSNNNVI